MNDFTEATINNSRVRLEDGSEHDVYFIRAGREGWNIPVIVAYDEFDNIIAWDTNGISISGDSNIMEITE